MKTYKGELLSSACVCVYPRREGSTFLRALGLLIVVSILQRGDTNLTEVKQILELCFMYLTLGWILQMSCLDIPLNLWQCFDFLK